MSNTRFPDKFMIEAVKCFAEMHHSFSETFRRLGLCHNGFHTKEVNAIYDKKHSKTLGSFVEIEGWDYLEQHGRQIV